MALALVEIKEGGANLGKSGHVSEALGWKPLEPLGRVAGAVQIVAEGSLGTASPALPRCWPLGVAGAWLKAGLARMAFATFR